MKTFREYEELIRTRVAQENDKDPNWNWSVHSFGKDLVRIRWGYLDYCQEKNNCFLFRLLSVPESEGYEEHYVTTRTPHDEMIYGEFVTENPGYAWQTTYEKGIKIALEALFDYAHSRY